MAPECICDIRVFEDLSHLGLDWTMRSREAGSKLGYPARNSWEILWEIHVGVPRDGTSDHPY